MNITTLAMYFNTIVFIGFIFGKIEEREHFRAWLPLKTWILSWLTFGIISFSIIWVLS